VRGQDGRLLHTLLASRGEEIVGIDRPRNKSALDNTDEFLQLDLCDEKAVFKLLAEYRPDRIFHFAACHHSSEQNDDATVERQMIRTNFLAAEVLLAGVLKICPSCRVLMAGSSQMYRPVGAGQTVIDEATATNPATFYGHTKAWSRELLDHYRNRHGLFCLMAILFNHESPLRGPRFLTRKVTMAAARAYLGQPPNLQIRNISAAVDWSSAQDFVEAMSCAMDGTEPADYVLASGRATTVEELLGIAFGAVGLDWRDHTVSESESAMSVPTLVGDAGRALRVLGWQPRESFTELITRMVTYDLQLLGSFPPLRR